MSPQSKIALYYHFAPLDDPDAVALWQKELCKRLGLTGRIIISPHGINGTVGGPIRAVKEYVKNTRGYTAFTDLEVKWSDGSEADFPRLSVKVKPELVAFDKPEEIQVAPGNQVLGTAPRLSPQEVNELVARREAEGRPVTFFDGRNAFEAQIGKFKDAVVPDTTTTRDFITEIESGKYDHLKDQPVITYCTGGIRCEALTVLMANRGFQELYQIDGGIVRYGEAYGDEGLWEGSLYVFDERMAINFSDTPKVIGSCQLCNTPTAQLRNCTDPGCKTLAVMCDQCHETLPERVCDTCTTAANATAAH
jgi:UPF0176 protein